MSHAEKETSENKRSYKWMACLVFDGSWQVEKVHYDQTYYVPVASWEMICMLLAMVLRNNWKTQHLDYVLTFPQAPAERELYMKVPRGINVESEMEHVLKVERNLYGQNQASSVWNLCLV
jgi:Reverse transcriptase (RNA-dependent DNA polymerase)